MTLDSSLQFVHVYGLQASGWIPYCLDEILVTVCSIFSAFLHRFSLFWFFIPFLHKFAPVADSVFFSICYRFYLHFLEISTSKQWSLNVGKMDIGSVSSKHCSNILFNDFEQVIVCWRTTALDYRSFLLFLE